MQRDEFCETKLLQPNIEKVATVYWLHLKEHTDIFTQGYIGVTTRLIDIRFREHCSRFKSSYSNYNPLHLAFAQYGLENIIRTRLCVCSVREAYEVERLFRPFEYMGWNTTEGGKVSKMALEIINRKNHALFKN
jgi:hypothetical protein